MHLLLSFFLILAPVLFRRSSCQHCSAGSICFRLHKTSYAARPRVLLSIFHHLYLIVPSDLRGTSDSSESIEQYRIFQERERETSETSKSDEIILSLGVGSRSRLSSSISNHRSFFSNFLNFHHPKFFLLKSVEWKHYGRPRIRATRRHEVDPVSLPISSQGGVGKGKKRVHDPPHTALHGFSSGPA